eukprot:Lankesteria_metandrocarpae@DN10827_c0_g1_i1.p1
MAHTFQLNSAPPPGAGLPPAPGLPPARYGGWSPVLPQPGQSTAVVPHPVIRGNQWLPSVCGEVSAGKCVVPACQPIIPVPVYQEVIRKDKIIEIPQTVVVDKLTPTLLSQKILHDVPDVQLKWKENQLTVPRVEFVEKIIEIPVPVGYNFKLVPKWETREAPKVIPKYIGKQETLEVDVPQIKIVDKTVEREVPVFVGEKIVEREVIEEDFEEIIEYAYVEKQHEVPIYKYRPVFDVEIDIPAPLIVPIPVKPEDKDIGAERLSLQEYCAIIQQTRETGHGCCSP